MSETVLVTGGTGFIGSWCIVELLRRGYLVRTTVRNLSSEPTVRAAISTVVDPGAVDPGDRLTFHASELTSDAGWDAAVAGCDYVLHVASPLGIDNPKNPDDLIVPAREGTLRVLRAATRAGVRRVVVTSSIAAATPSPYGEERIIDESFWTDPDEKPLNAYRKSKTLSERAAWEFMKANAGNTTPSAMTMTTILPGAVFGPVLMANKLGSVQVISRLLKGRVPGNPRLALEMVDVRDVADLHIRAMESPEAAGERFIAVSDIMWMAEISQTLRAKLGSAAAKVPTRNLPDFVLKLFALFDPSVRSVTPLLGRKVRHTSEKAQRILGWQPRPAAETVVDCAESLIKLKAV